MKFSIVVAISIYCLIFSSIEAKAQSVKNNRDKSYVEEDKLIGKIVWSSQDSIAKEQDHNQLKAVVECQALQVKCGTNGTVAEEKAVTNSITTYKKSEIKQSENSKMK
ncbi:hypothetical protein [Flavobacterium anhuiense]|uniref:hypothetical protein n=1 Tax=Flavobacterium anhuiense TaxID=459526 RepID=UPI003D97DD77